MSYREFNKFVSGTAALLIAGTTCTTWAAPGDGPEVEISADVDGMITVDMLAGTNVGGNLYAYSGSTVGSTYQIDWSLLINNDAGAGVENGLEIFSTSINVSNTGDATSTFNLSSLFNVNLGANPMLYGGSFSGSLTGGKAGGSLTDTAGAPLWSALLNNTAFHSFYDSGFDFSTDPFGSTDIPAVAFGEPIPDMVGPDSSMMGSSLMFSLGAGSTVSMASTFVAQVPAPGSIALLAIGLFNARRRRRA